MSTQQIRKRLETILEYMQPHWDFVNCHMVNYLTDNHWDGHVPAALRAEVPNVEQVRRCIETVYWQHNVEDKATVAHDMFPLFTKFMQHSEAHRLHSFTEALTNVEQLQQLLALKPLKQRLSIKEFMSEKKGHEVEITAELVDDLIRSRLDAQHTDVFVIDAGDGKGYLSTRLVFQYGHKVLGLDANMSNTENALERSKKLNRVWNGLATRAKLIEEGVKPPRRGKKVTEETTADCVTASADLDNYRTSASYITSNLDILQLVEAHFPASTKPRALCLTGLHTCGNLAPTCLRLFHAQPQFRLLCNIGCCYHLLKESYSEPEFFANETLMQTEMEPGFPMSKFLHEKGLKLGRNARMLAAQSIERTLNAKELPNISLYYRALLEVLICEQDVGLKNTVRVGKIRKYETFQQYVQKCVNRATFRLDELSSDRIEALELAYAEHRHYLDLFYLLRMSFAPVLESLILLDRLLYLKELGYTQSYLVPLFDAVISPRHFAIVSVK